MNIKLIITFIILLIYFVNGCRTKEMEEFDLIECLQKEKVLDSIVFDTIIYITLNDELSSKLKKQDCYEYIGSKNICFVSMSQIFMYEIREYFIISDAKILHQDRFKFSLIYKGGF